MYVFCSYNFDYRGLKNKKIHKMRSRAFNLHFLKHFEIEMPAALYSREFSLALFSVNVYSTYLMMIFILFFRDNSSFRNTDVFVR